VSILLEKKGQKVLDKWLIKGKTGKEVEYKGKVYPNIFGLVDRFQKEVFPSSQNPIVWWITKRM